MPIDFKCGSCGKTLRVPDESAGKKARCSSCQTVVNVPGGAPSAVPVSTAGAGPPPANPYGVPNPGPQFGSKMPQVNTGSIRADAIAPLLDAGFWMQLLGWVWIIQGALCCITIIGAIVGWLPLWLGICLKNAGDSMKAGLSDGNVHKATSNLKTYFTIMGVLMIINLVIMVLYILFAIIFGLAAVGGAFGTITF